MDSDQKNPTIRKEEFQMGPWKLGVTESHILTSLGPKREYYEKVLADLPNLPEMLFDENVVKIQLVNPSNTQSPPMATLEFNALDALKCVDTTKATLTVAAAKEWKEARMESDTTEHLEVHRPFDWTYTTDYAGTLTGAWKVERTDERINMESLKKQEKILFFLDVNLFEDELGDNGCSLLNVKLRAMPSGFFLLQRFFLRVDHCLLRVIDTRVYWQNGSEYILREVRRKESDASEIQGVDNMGSILPGQADQYCVRLVEDYTEKLFIHSVPDT